MILKLKEFRIQRNLTQKEIASETGITFQTYSSYETGRTDPSPEILIKLADFFDVTVDELLGRERSELFEDARIKRPKILMIYEELPPPLQENLLNYAQGMAIGNAYRLDKIDKKKKPNIGPMLKKLRIQKKLLQKDIARILDVAPTTYLSYEKGINEPSLDKLCLLANFFDVSVDELLGRV